MKAITCIMYSSKNENYNYNNENENQTVITAVRMNNVHMHNGKQKATCMETASSLAL